MVVLFPKDQVALGCGELRREEDVGAESGEEFIELCGAGGMESWEIACFRGRTRSVCGLNWRMEGM